MESSSPACQAAEFQKLRHQHAQLLDFNHVLIKENNHRLVDHAELTSEVKVIHCISKASLAGMFLLAAAFLSPHTPPPLLRSCIAPTFLPLFPSCTSTGLNVIVIDAS